MGKYSKVLRALWDGEDANREKIVSEALTALQVPEVRCRIVLTQVLSVIPEFRNRRNECGGSLDALNHFDELLTEVLEGQIEFPKTVEDLIGEIHTRVKDSYKN